MKETFIAISGLLLQIVVGIAPIFLFKMAIVSKSALGRLAGTINSKTQGLTNKAKDFGEGRNFYQRRQMAREARQQERRRGSVENYANRVSGEGWRASMLRRRAAGGVRAQVIGGLTRGGVELNRAGQQRIGQAAEEQLRRQRHEEATRALQRMTTLGVEGDQDLVDIATAQVGSEFAQQRNGVATGVRMQVTQAERQAAINSLVQQGRVGRLRDLERTGPARGPGGTPNPDNELHHMLDEAYTTIPNKLGDKAPDLMPNRRATNGVAAFTDLQADDVAGWHESTVSAARDFFNTQRLDAAGNVVQIGGRDANLVERERMLRALSQATQSPTTRSRLSLEQMRQAREIMRDARAAGFTDRTVMGQIETAYRQMGGT